MYTVRQAKGNDAQELTNLVKLHDSANHLSNDLSYVTGSLDTNPTERVYVAESHDHIVGYVSIQVTSSFAYSRPAVELVNIYVKENYRRQGVGSLLLNRVKKVCIECNALELFLRVNRHNTPAMLFYNNNGLDDANHFIYRIRYYE